MKTLVVVIGNLRGGEKTWNSMYENLLLPFNADLALCIGYSEDKSSSMYSKAKYLWELPEYEEWGDYWIENFGDGPWKKTVNIGWNTGWCGLYGSTGSSMIHIAFRHHLYKEKKEILLQYERIVITRSDFFYVKPHPILDNNYFWIPRGEGYGGITDRHQIFPSKDIDYVLSICEKYVNTLNIFHDFNYGKYLNLEQAFAKYFERTGYYKKVKQYRRVNFSVYSKGDSSRWISQSLENVPYSDDLYFKYKDEYIECMKNIHMYEKYDEMSPNMLFGQPF